jgi:hypothetical protein
VNEQDFESRRGSSAAAWRSFDIHSIPLPAKLNRSSPERNTDWNLLSEKTVFGVTAFAGRRCINTPPAK